MVGTTGSGKTTFARELARHLGVPHIELDAIRHQAGWVELPDSVFRERLAVATAADGWVVDGNYGGIGARDIVWPKADTLVWLDTPLIVNLWRVTRRSIRRMVTLRNSLDSEIDALPGCTIDLPDIHGIGDLTLGGAVNVLGAVQKGIALIRKP